MSRCVEVKYYVVFGKGDGTEHFSYDFELDDETEAVYDKAIELEEPFENFPELTSALQDAYDEIEEMESSNLADLDEEYSDLSDVEMDTEDLNDLVHQRNPHALKFFHLENATDEEIEEWDANDLDNLPTHLEFDEYYKPLNPFDNGISLTVYFAEDPALA